MSIDLLPRPARTEELRQALATNPVVALLGPRQCGKSTLARQLTGASAFFDLENAADRQALGAAPQATLQDLRGLVVLDEIQLMPELFSVLRVLADRRPQPATFLVLGSSSPDLVRGAAESLAGRIAFIHLSGFDLSEVPEGEMSTLWHRGGFPRSFLAPDAATSFSWRQNFIETFLTRDAARMGIEMPPEALRRFWTMLAHLHGGKLNGAELGRALSVDNKTATRYVGLLSAAFLIRRLPPWFENAGKRTVKSPKIYLRDSGLLHALLGLRDGSEVLSHPRFGASWEGFALEQIIGFLHAERDSYFWGTHAGAELDLLVVRGGKKYGFEIKYTDAPRTTKAMHVAIADLGLERLFAIYPGARRYELGERMTAMPISELALVAGRL